MTWRHTSSNGSTASPINAGGRTCENARWPAVHGENRAARSLLNALVMRKRVLLILTFVTLACGGDDQQPTDTGPPAPDASDVGSFVVAEHPPAPTVASSGGSVLSSPKVVIVTFGNDPLAPQMESFAQSLGQSAYWTAVTGEYGVGRIAFGGAVHIATAPSSPLSQTDFEAWLTSQLDGTHADWPAYDPSTIYAVVYPPHTGVLSFGAPLCQGTPAYHDEIVVSATEHIVYAEVNRCDPLFGLQGIDYVTAGLSHELVEATTDPYFNSGPAFYSPPPKYNDWMLVTGGELADMCTTTTAVYFKPSDLPYTVQRSWSNAAATSGLDPCVPSPDGAYFGAAPVLPDTLHGTYYGQALTTEGVHVAIGDTVPIEVDLFSDGPTDVFNVRASADLGAQLEFSWDQTTGQNGDKRVLNVTRVHDGPDTSGMALFTIIATLGDRQSAWVGAVGD